MNIFEVFSEYEKKKKPLWVWGKNLGGLEKSKFWNWRSLIVLFMSDTHQELRLNDLQTDWLHISVYLNSKRQIWNYSLKIQEAISRTTAVILGLFVLILINFSCWIQIWQWKFDSKILGKSWRILTCLDLDTQVECLMGEKVNLVT